MSRENEEDALLHLLASDLPNSNSNPLERLENASGNHPIGKKFKNTIPKKVRTFIFLLDCFSSSIVN
jgi:hypothetical protein